MACWDKAVMRMSRTYISALLPKIRGGYMGPQCPALFNRSAKSWCLEGVHVSDKASTMGFHVSISEHL